MFFSSLQTMEICADKIVEARKKEKRKYVCNSTFLCFFLFCITQTGLLDTHWSHMLIFHPLSLSRPHDYIHWSAMFFIQLTLFPFSLSLFPSLTLRYLTMHLTLASSLLFHTLIFIHFTLLLFIKQSHLTTI